jgi:Family of unknown function (DUF6498)
MRALPSAILLVAVNLIPLVGVMFWGWSLMMILVLYWVESGIVGVINIFKIARAEGSEDEPPVSLEGSRIVIRIGSSMDMTGKGSTITFFIIHYGIFWVVHGVFVFLLPLFAGLASPQIDLTAPNLGIGAMDFGPLPLDGVLFATIGLTVSHVVSFYVNFLGRGEYLRVTPTEQMFSVYGRVVVLHVTIIAGATVIALFGTPVAALVLLVGVKTLIDLGLHLRAHRDPISAR